MSKCDTLIDNIGGKFKKSVKSFFSPRSLLQSSDIVFVCVSSQDVANRIFRYNFGINNPKDTILKNKGEFKIHIMVLNFIFSFSKNLSYSLAYLCH